VWRMTKDISAEGNERIDDFGFKALMVGRPREPVPLLNFV